ncbi:acetyltransferase (GNAT) family containing protein [Rhizoctonia solani 123E]|uniref:Acetyltransferase (GNAT) family containing protein n=1 Tax=Rhizoctonia solani 123E TaxID=1423351 RepID=A0A074RXN4_9AGAM|nr:acetyltransferase (GNAT) family containing protein [Rhizoctonia solani 123E]
MSSPRSEYSDASSVTDFDASSIVYRPMNSCDMAQVESLHNELVKQRLPRMFLHQSLYHPHRRTIVAELPTESGKPVLAGFASAHVSTKPDWPKALEPEVDLLTLGVRPEYRHHHIAENLIKVVTASLINTCQFKASEEGALVHADIRCGHVNRAFFEKMAWEEDKEFQRALPWARCDATRFVTRVVV